MLDDGEDLPDSFIETAPNPSSISVNRIFKRCMKGSPEFTLIVVPPKLSSLFDKVQAEVTLVASLQVRFDPAKPAKAPAAIHDDEDQTKRYYDYDAPEVAPGSGRSALKSLLEIPILWTSPSTLTLRLPNLDPSISHQVTSAIVDQLVLNEGLPGFRIPSLVILAPCEMSVGAPAMASLYTSASKAKLDVPLLQPPHCIQGGPASLLSICESRNVPATALLIRAEGPLGHELVDRDTVPSLVALLNTKYALGLSTKSFQQGSGMYI